MHIYTCENGNKVPSVTTILQCLGSKELMKWANYLGFKHISYEEELNRTALNGTKIHTCLQHIVDPSLSLTEVKFKNQFDELYYLKIINRFKELITQYQYETIFTEKDFASSNLGYGGQIDWLAKMNNKTILIDFKSSKKVHIKHLLQLGGYRNLLKEHNIELDGAAIFIVNETICFPYFIDSETLMNLGNIFNYLKNVYDCINSPIPVSNKELQKSLLKDK